MGYHNELVQEVTNKISFIRGAQFSNSVFLREEVFAGVRDCLTFPFHRWLRHGRQSLWKNAPFGLGFSFATSFSPEGEKCSLTLARPRVGAYLASVEDRRRVLPQLGQFSGIDMA